MDAEGQAFVRDKGRLDVAAQRAQGEDNAPHDFCCPITQELMSDPVMASDGHTYERAAIERWFESNQTSPLTGEELASKALVPNMMIRSMVHNSMH